MNCAARLNGPVSSIVVALSALSAAAIPARAELWLSLGPDGVPVLKRQATGEPPLVTLLSAGAEGLDVVVATPGLALRRCKIAGREFVAAGWPGAPRRGAVGAPAVPVVRRLFLAPRGAAVSLTTRQSAPVIIDAQAAGLPLRLMPVQPPLRKVRGAAQQGAPAYDAAAYARDEQRPARRATVTELGTVRGRRLFLLEVRPLAYNPLRQTLRLWPSLRATVEFVGGTPARRPAAPPGLGRVVLNPGDDHGGASGGGNYLVVCAAAFETQIGQFVAAKRDQGFNVLTYSVPAGTSNSTIKGHIAELWGTPDAPDYILLVGDTDTIPHWRGGGDYSPDTDLPYACMDGPDDWYPDIALGRFPVRAARQLTDVVAKTLLFEDGPLPDPGYVGRAAFMASEDHYWISEGTHNWTIDNYMAPNDVVSDKLYCHSYHATTQQVRDAFNDGRVYGIYSGHGYAYGWADGPPFSQDDVRNLANAGAYPLVCSFACDTGEYSLTECFTETWILVPEKGAAAVWGSSVSSYWDEDDILQKKLFEVLYDDYVRELGPALNLTRLRYAEYWGNSSFTRMYFEMYNLMGDPSIYIPDTDTPLRVTPREDLVAQGPPGGPFTPDSISYELSNTGDYAIEYEVTHDGADWVTLSGELAGVLPPDGSAQVNVEINSGAGRLPQGRHQDVVYFTNLSDHVGDTTRAVILDVGVPAVQYAWTLDSDPGWSTQGLWAFGQPAGRGGQYGGPDPGSGYTGANVYGYNLQGDYENNLPERHLTTAAIDCGELFKVSLKFWRWLGVEQPSYDHAYLRLSTDGANWTTIWENTSEIADYSWNFQDLDISALADGQPTVYLRWTMGPTDASWQYCGWNIDDIEIWGIAPPQQIPGDLDRDGDVDQADLGILLGDWGCTGTGGPCIGDCDGDGDTDQADLGVLLGNWGYGT